MTDELRAEKPTGRRQPSPAHRNTSLHHASKADAATKRSIAPERLSTARLLDRAPDRASRISAAPALGRVTVAPRHSHANRIFQHATVRSRTLRCLEQGRFHHTPLLTARGGRPIRALGVVSSVPSWSWLQKPRAVLNRLSLCFVDGEMSPRAALEWGQHRDLATRTEPPPLLAPPVGARPLPSA